MLKQVTDVFLRSLLVTIARKLDTLPIELGEDVLDIFVFQLDSHSVVMCP